MSRYWIIGIAVVAVIVLLAAFWMRGWELPTSQSPQTEQATTTTTGTVPSTPAGTVYRNPTYGYTFTYPEGVTVHEYTPSSVAVGTPLQGGFASQVDVSVADSGGEGGYESFQEFVFEWGRLLCSADGPNQTMHCDRLERREPFTTASGISGAAYYFRLVRQNFETGTESVSTFGPVYAFDMRENVPDADFAAVLIYAPLPTYTDDSNHALANAIASSLVID